MISLLKRETLTINAVCVCHHDAAENALPISQHSPIHTVLQSHNLSVCLNHSDVIWKTVFIELEMSDKLEWLNQKFSDLRLEFEEVYSKTRNINKVNSYFLDQDHHNHTANQSLNMDWQFIAEIKLFEKINLTYN